MQTSTPDSLQGKKKIMRRKKKLKGKQLENQERRRGGRGTQEDHKLSETRRQDKHVQ